MKVIVLEVSQLSISPHGFASHVVSGLLRVHGMHFLFQCVEESSKSLRFVTFMKNSRKYHF